MKLSYCAFLKYSHHAIFLFKHCTHYFEKYFTTQLTSISWHHVNNNNVFEVCTYYHIDYFNAQQAWKTDTSPKKLLGRKEGLEKFISWFISPIKTILDKYLNLLKCHMFENLLLMAEEEEMIKKNCNVRSVYTVSHMDF